MPYACLCSSTSQSGRYRSFCHCVSASLVCICSTWPTVSVSFSPLLWPVAPLSLYISHSATLSVCLSVCVSIYICVCIIMYVYMYIYKYIWCVCVCVCLSLDLSLYLLSVVIVVVSSYIFDNGTFYYRRGNSTAAIWCSATIYLATFVCYVHKISWTTR